MLLTFKELTLSIKKSSWVICCNATVALGLMGFCPATPPTGYVSSCEKPDFVARMLYVFTPGGTSIIFIQPSLSVVSSIIIFGFICVFSICTCAFDIGKPAVSKTFIKELHL